MYQKVFFSGKSTPPLPATRPEFEFQLRNIIKNCAVVLSKYSPFPISLKNHSNF